MQCEKCGQPHDGSYGSGRFCSKICARSFSTASKRADINRRVSQKAKGRPSPLKGISKGGRKYNPPPRKYKPFRECEVCGGQHKNNRFCSKDCFLKSSTIHRDALTNYRHACRFSFNIYEYPDEFDLALLQQLGWYSPTNKRNNLQGVSRDHMFSVGEGFRRGIDPAVINHPANCALLPHSQNSAKKTKCSISLDELLHRINTWETKYPNPQEETIVRSRYNEDYQPEPVSKEDRFYAQQKKVGEVVQHIDDDEEDDRRIEDDQYDE